MAALKQQIEGDPGALRWRSQAAKERAVRERQARVQKALDRLPELMRSKRGKNAKEARASTTDAEATVMKMGDGGFRPAYNVQYGTDSESQVIVGAEVVTVGSDQGQRVPMLEQVTERCERSPEQYLVDGGYPAHEHIDAAAQHASTQTDGHRPARAEGGRQRGSGGMAGADGHRGGQDNLQGSGGDGWPSFR